MRHESFARRTRALKTLLGAAPWWASLPAGLALVVLGCVLVLQPLTSLTALALYSGASMIITGLADAFTAQSRGRVAMAVAWILAGAALALGRGFSIGVLAIVTAALLGIAAVIRAIEAFQSRGSARWAAIAFAVADAIFAAVAALWPDATLVVLAIAFGARTLVFGAETSWRALRTGLMRPERMRRTRRRGTRIVASLAVLAVAAGIGSTSAYLRADSPVVDDFAVPPAHVPTDPGHLIASEPFSRDVPHRAEGWRILYTTTTADGRPTVSTGIVIAPRDRADGPLPVVSWAHGTTGFAANCAPSLAREPFASGAMMVPDRVIDEGWAMVATDYSGLGTAGSHPYLIGGGEARSVLDATRAAQELAGLSLADDTVVWGHSQGGHAALWTGDIAERYAPELGIIGVAALAPASDVPALAERLTDVTGGDIFASYVLAAYSDAYSDVNSDAYVRAEARTHMRESSRRCLAERGAIVSLLGSLASGGGNGVFSTSPATGALGERLAENVPSALFDAPLLIGQGLADTLVTPEMQSSYVTSLRRSGREVDARTYPGLDHLALVAADSPAIDDLFAWTRRLIAG